MSWFPQIGAGSMAQFPLQRSRKWRAIMNDLESGERIMRNLATLLARRLILVNIKVDLLSAY